MSKPDAFVNAAACGDLDDIKRMLADVSTTGDVINRTDKDGRTALHYACLNDDVNLLPLLLADDRVDLGKTTPNNECVFHLAALYNSLQAINLLIAKKEVMDLDLINFKNKFEESPLHLCAGTGNKASGKTALILMRNGASVTAVDKWSRGPLDVAIFNGHQWLADIIQTYVNSLDESIQTEVKAISEKAAKERTTTVEVSEKAVEDQKKLKSLFAGGLNINLKKTTTVEKQIFSSGQGKIISGGSTTPAGPVNHRKILSKLIDFPGDREEINKLIKDPELDVSGKDAFGLTAIHKFASWNKPELIELIAPRLTRNDYNQTDLEGKTALHWACEMASVSTVKYLMANGADKSLKDKKGRTPLDILNTGSGDVIARLKAALGEEE